MTTKKIERTILIDEPATKDLFHGKGHERTAEALANAIKNFRDQDRAIGLDGPWGSGKSSVVEIAEQKLRAETASGNIRFHFFTFDIWQSQGSAFRRSFLEHFLDWSNTNFPEHGPKILDIEKRVKGKVRHVHSNNKFVLDWYGIAALLLIPILPIYYFWAKSWFDDAVKTGKTFFSSPPFLALILFLFASLFRAWQKYKNINKSNSTRSWSEALAQFQLAVSQTLLISAKQFEDQTVTQHIREIDPNDFEFQSTFREILSIVQSKNTKIVVVLDNIDRLPKEEIEEYWALVRAVFSHGPSSKSLHSKSSITAIVPYDRHHISPSEKAPRTSSEDSETAVSSLSSREIFSKTFNEILTISPPVMSNSRDFFQEKIGTALPSFEEKDDLFRVYLIFNQILKEENGKATPRQIISFINELTGLYVLHQGLFSLPTIAVYIAYQDSLEDNPTQLTRRSVIGEKIRSIASDPNLERNLAALIFNVEPDLAFQILLDDQIKNAASATTADPLLAIANSAGFDLRVSEVVQANIREWQSAGVFNFIVQNFATLIQSYKGDAARHFAKAIVIGFRDIGVIGLAPNAFKPYLKLYDLCDQNDITAVTQHLFECISSALNDIIIIGLKDGKLLVDFLLTVKSSLKAVAPQADIKNAMAALKLPSDPSFILGLANATFESEIEFSEFSEIAIDLSSGQEVLEHFAITTPEIARNAFSELKSVALIKSPQWVSIANALLNDLKEEETADSDLTPAELALLSDAWISVESNKRSEIKLTDALTAQSFFKNIYATFSEDIENLALSYILFLAGNIFYEKGLNAPSVADSNGQQIQDASTEFNWLREIMAGRTPLTEKQYDLIADQIKKAPNVGAWIAWGASNPENSLISIVIKKAFLSGETPHTLLAVVLKHYQYLKVAIGEDWVEALHRYAIRVTERSVDSITIDMCPEDFLSDIHHLSDSQWSIFERKIGNQLDAITASEWKTHLQETDHIAKILNEKIETSGHILGLSEFKDIYKSLILDILKDEITPSIFNYDSLLKAIRSEFHPDIYRNIREEMRDVNSKTLKMASDAFPALMANVLSSGERISRDEKENIVRYILCSALEGENVIILNEFLRIGREKVNDYIKNSQDVTKSKKDGSWKHFSENCTDRDLVRRISELLYGKRKSKSYFDMSWFLGTGDEKDETI